MALYGLAYNLCITAVSSVTGVVFDPVLLDTEVGRIDTATSTRLATSGYTTPPTVESIQSGLAKTSEIPSVPTTTEIAESVWTRSSRLITGGAPTANAVASSVWSADARTITATPTYNGPTVSEIADAVGSVDLTAIQHAAVGSLKTLYLLQTNTGMTNDTMTVYDVDGSEHAHYDVTTDPDTGITSVRIPEE